MILDLRRKNIEANANKVKLDIKPNDSSNDNFNLSLADYIYRGLKKNKEGAIKEVIKKGVNIYINLKHKKIHGFTNLVVDCLEGKLYLESDEGQKYHGRLKSFVGDRKSDAYYCALESLGKIIDKLKRFEYKDKRVKANMQETFDKIDKDVFKLDPRVIDMRVKKELDPRIVDLRKKELDPRIIDLRKKPSLPANIIDLRRKSTGKKIECSVNTLHDFYDVTEFDFIDIGSQDVEVDKIDGISSGRADEYNSDYTPIDENDPRWIYQKELVESGKTMEPIPLVKAPNGLYYGDGDGSHRISVSKVLGLSIVPARVHVMVPNDIGINEQWEEYAKDKIDKLNDMSEQYKEMKRKLDDLQEEAYEKDDYTEYEEYMQKMWEFDDEICEFSDSLLSEEKEFKDKLIKEYMEQ